MTRTTRHNGKRRATVRHGQCHLHPTHFQALPCPALPMPCCPINSTSVPPYRRASGFPLLLTSLISACASQPGLNNNRAGATTWRMMGPRLVHPASLPYTSLTPCSRTVRHPAPCTLHPCACAWACARRPPVQPRTIPCISHSATEPYLYATTVPTLSILNLVVFPSTVADHPSLGVGLARSSVGLVD